MSKRFSLLPHTKQKIHGLSCNSAQVMGWEITKFSIPTLWRISTGKNVKVAVLDTGCDINHSDLKDNISRGWNTIDNNDDVTDENGHGTHVAGTIAATNNGTGMVGVAPETTILPVKVLNKNGSGKEKNIVDGILWATDNKCDIISMSLSSTSPSRTVENAIKYAAEKGCVIFCAAGNSGEESEIMYPARYNSTIAIGSINRNLERSSFSCCGIDLDFLSPGEDIFSCAPNNSYAIMSGTSMATPFAVGCASLLLSMQRQKNPKKILKQQEYIDIFARTALPLTNNKLSDKRYAGHGIIQPVRSLT